MAGSVQSPERHAGPLGRLFDEYFYLVRAASEAEKLTAYRLRGEVYAEYLGPDHFPDGLDRDEYDAAASHSLLYHRPSGACAGTVRLICPPAEEGPWLFPMEAIAGRYLDSVRAVLESVPRACIGEVSRFCLSRRFRGRCDERLWPDGVAEAKAGKTMDGERRCFLHPILGLIAAAIGLSQAAGISLWYTVMEPRLYRRLQQFGLRFQPAGSEFEFYGTRQAYVAYLPELLAGMQLTHPDVWAFLADGGRVTFSPSAACQAAVAELARHGAPGRAGPVPGRRLSGFGGHGGSPSGLAAPR